MGRAEVEPLCAHEPRGDRVLAGEVLDQGLGQASAFLRLRSGDEPSSFEARNVVGDTAGALRKEHICWGPERVISERRGDCLLKRALAIGSDAVVYEHA